MSEKFFQHQLEAARADGDYDRWRYWLDLRADWQRGLPLGWVR